MDKTKKIDIFKKELKKTTNIIIFSMKLYPYIPENKKNLSLIIWILDIYIKNINNDKNL